MAGAAVALALAAPAAQAASPSKVSISYASSKFAGKVSSPDADCRRGRKVKVFQVNPGADPLVVSDRTNRRGRWSARKPGAAGAFYAKAKKKRGCRGDRSKQLITGIVRVEIAPAGILLTADGDTERLRAIARDASNRAIPGLPAATWSSDDGATVSVSGSGLATAQDDSGSAQITARVAGRSSNPILATIAAPAPGSLLITDSNIVSGPTLTDPDAEPSFESTFDVVLTGIAPPAIDALIVNTGSKPVVGRVVSVEDLGAGQLKVTLHQVSIEEAFPDLEISETLDLSGAAAEINPEIASDYNVKRTGDAFAFTPKTTTLARYRRASGAETMAAGTAALPPFSECEAETTPSSDSLPVELEAPPLFTVEFDPDLEILYTASGDLEKLAVKLKPKVTVEGGIKVAAAFEGKVECKVELGALRVPAGPISALITGLVPFGVGIEAAGKMTIADAGISTKAEAEGTAEAGIVCPPSDPEDDCSFAGSVDADASLEPELDAPSISDVRFEPSLEAFGFAELSVGNPFLASIRFDTAEAKAGAKLEGSFASKTSQIAADDYKSSYKASLEASAKLGTELEGAAELLGLGEITGLAVEVSDDLANSPSGVLSADRKTWLSGETVTFTAHLSELGFFPSLVPYNIDEVLLIRNSAGNVTEEGSHTPAPGDDEVTFDYTATDLGNSDEFYLFVVTKLVPFDLFSLELAQAKTECADGIDNDGDTKIDYPADPNCESADDGSEAASLTVSVSPSSVTLTTGGTQQFTATVAGTVNDAVTWNATCGSISASGLYTAPTSPGTCTVTATSVEDPSKSNSATVTVSGGGGAVQLTSGLNVGTVIQATDQWPAGCSDPADDAGAGQSGLGTFSGSVSCSGDYGSASASQTSGVQAAADGQDWLSFQSTVSNTGLYGQGYSARRVDFTVAGASAQLSCHTTASATDPDRFYVETYIDTAVGPWFQHHDTSGASITNSTPFAPGNHFLLVRTFASGNGESGTTSGTSDVVCDFDGPVSIAG